MSLFSRLTKRREQSFTMIELLVVVIIVAILAAVAVPVYIGVQNNAKKRSLDSDVANTKINLAAALVEDNTIADVTVTSATASSARMSGDAQVQFSGSPTDESIWVNKVASSAQYFVTAKSGSVDYCVQFSSQTGQTATYQGSQCTPGSPTITAVVTPSVSASATPTPTPTVSVNPDDDTQVLPTATDDNCSNGSYRPSGASGPLVCNAVSPAAWTLDFSGSALQQGYLTHKSTDYAGNFDASYTNNYTPVYKVEKRKYQTGKANILKVTGDYPAMNWTNAQCATDASNGYVQGQPGSYYKTTLNDSSMSFFDANEAAIAHPAGANGYWAIEFQVRCNSQTRETYAGISVAYVGAAAPYSSWAGLNTVKSIRFQWNGNYYVLGSVKDAATTSSASSIAKPTSSSLLRPSLQGWYYTENQPSNLYTVNAGTDLSTLAPTAAETAALSSVVSFYKTWTGQNSTYTTGTAASHYGVDQMVVAANGTYKSTIIAGGGGTTSIVANAANTSSLAFTVPSKDGKYAVEILIPYGQTSIGASPWFASVVETPATANALNATSGSATASAAAAAWESSTDGVIKSGAKLNWSNGASTWSSFRVKG